MCSPLLPHFDAQFSYHEKALSRLSLSAAAADIQPDPDLESRNSMDQMADAIEDRRMRLFTMSRSDDYEAMKVSQRVIEDALCIMVRISCIHTLKGDDACKRANPPLPSDSKLRRKRDLKIAYEPCRAPIVVINILPMEWTGPT